MLLTLLPAFPMAYAENSPENYATLLQSVACNLPPFLQYGGEPSVPLVAWFTAYNAALLVYQVFQGTDLTDQQKNPLLYDLLGDAGRQQPGLHVDMVHMEADTTPHVAFLQAIRLHLQDPVNCNGATEL